MNNPLISIIIPTFNSRRTIKQCLDSIICQTFHEYEVIIMDGASMDGTLETVAHYAKDFRSIRVISASDRGIYDAMNNGVSHAKGRWLYFIGSDDTLYDDAVLSNVSSFRFSERTLMVYGKALIHPDNWVTPIRQSFEDVRKANLCHQAIFYNKEVFGRWSYDLRFKMLADWDLNLRIFGAYPERIEDMDLIVCNYNNQGFSANWRKSEEYLKYFANPSLIDWKYRPKQNAISQIARREARKLLRIFR